MPRGRTTGRGTRRGAAAAASASRALVTGGDGAIVIQDSPSTSTTATPVPTVAGSSEQNPTAPSSSSVRRGGTSTRTSRGAAPPVGRFRPRNVRRDESERDALAQQEQQKDSQRAAEERRARGRSRFRSKRSRGDTMGSRGGFGRPVAGASGPFSSGVAGQGITSGGGWLGGGGGGGGGGGSFSTSGKFEAKGTSGYSFVNDGRLREARINADRLHSNTHDGELDSEDEAMIAALHSQSASTMPMGIYRQEHKEVPVVVATTAELEAAENATGEEESLWVDGDAPRSVTPVDQPEEGNWNAESKATVKIKKEPADDDTMDVDTDTRPPPQGKIRQAIAKTKAKKLAMADPEESMIQTDLSLLASELGAVTINGEGEEKGEEPANKDGRLYLFQFPPLLPPLKQSAAAHPRVKVKNEGAVVASTSPPDTYNTSLAATPVDLTQDQAEDEGDNGDEDDDDGEPSSKKGFRSQLLANGGLIGKLNVRKSGKVELDWGGRVLEMSPAAGMSFLTTAVIVEESDEKPQNGVTTGESIGMGKIMGRFVLAPIWSEEEDWEVAEEELVVG